MLPRDAAGLGEEVLAAFGVGAAQVQREVAGIDILHVATALIVKGQRFLTFDANQKKLAEAEGLDVPL